MGFKLYFAVAIYVGVFGVVLSKDPLSEEPVNGSTDSPPDVTTDNSTDEPTDEPTDGPTSELNKWKSKALDEETSDVPTDEPTDVPTEILPTTSYFY